MHQAGLLNQAFKYSKPAKNNYCSNNIDKNEDNGDPVMLKLRNFGGAFVIHGAGCCFAFVGLVEEFCLRKSAGEFFQKDSWPNQIHAPATTRICRCWTFLVFSWNRSGKQYILKLYKRKRIQVKDEKYESKHTIWKKNILFNYKSHVEHSFFILSQHEQEHTILLFIIDCKRAFNQ